MKMLLDAIAIAALIALPETECCPVAASTGLAARKPTPIPDRHSAHPPGKAEWKAAGNRLTGRKLADLTRDVGREVRLRPSLRVP